MHLEHRTLILDTLGMLLGRLFLRTGNVQIFIHDTGTRDAARWQVDFGNDLALRVDTDDFAGTEKGDPKTAFGVLSVPVWETALVGRFEKGLGFRGVDCAGRDVVGELGDCGRGRVGEVDEFVVESPGCSIRDGDGLDYAVEGEIGI